METRAVKEQSQYIPKEQADISDPTLNDKAIKEAEILRQLKTWRTQAKSNLAECKRIMAEDADMYDGEQWSEDDKQVLQDRGQVPQVFNLIKTNIDWILGTERLSRVDWKMLPRKKEFTKNAEIKSKVFKYYNDINRVPYRLSQAYQEAVVSGLGWLEAGIKSDPTEPPIYVRAESWRNMWWDIHSQELDMSDARYVIREKWIDLDIAQAMFPKYRETLKRYAENVKQIYADSVYNEDDDPIVMDNGTFNVEDGTIKGYRPRIRLTECWYRKPEETQIIKSDGAENNSIFHKDIQDSVLSWKVENGYATIEDAIKMVTYCAIWTGDTLLQNTPSPYRHNRFPFVPIYCYRTGKDGLPYGVCRNIKDPQIDFNKRRSKALHILNSMGVIADKGAVDDIDVALTELARPDFWLEVNAGKNLKLNNGNDLAASHVQLMAQDQQLIQFSSGVTDENLGRQTNATSGIAIQSRQEQGRIVSGKVIDNRNLAYQMIGEIVTSLIEQFSDEDNEFRITGVNGTEEYVRINDPENLETDVTASKADFIVTLQNYQESYLLYAQEQLGQLLQKLPAEVALKVLDLYVEMMDIPNKDEFVDRIREITGVKSPGVELTPEQQQAEESMKMEAQMAKEMAMKMADLEIKIKESELAFKTAQAIKAESESVLKKVEAIYSGMQAAMTAVNIKGVVPVADEIIKSAGFKDSNPAPIVPPPIAPAGTMPLDMQPQEIIPNNTDPRFPAKPESPLVGVAQGIETPQNDGGIINGQE